MNKKLLVTSVLALIGIVLFVSYVQFESWRHDLSIEMAIPKYMPFSDEDIKELSPEDIRKMTSVFIHQYSYTEALLKKIITEQKSYVLWLSMICLFLSISILILIIKTPNKALQPTPKSGAPGL